MIALIFCLPCMKNMNTTSNNIRMKVSENKTYILEILKIHLLEREVPKQKLQSNATLNGFYIYIYIYIYIYLCVCIYVLKTSMTITMVCERSFRNIFLYLVINSHAICHLVGFYSHKSLSTINQ